MAKEKWSDNETHDLISYWEDHFEDYRRHKTPFYESAAKAVAIKGAKSVKNRCEHLERKYTAIKEKMSASGFGVSDDDPPTLKAAITKELKWYYELDNILGSSIQIRSQALVDTTQRISVANTSQQESTPPADGHDILPDIVAVHEHGQTHTFDNTPTINDTMSTSSNNPNKRKASDSITDFGERGLELERCRLELMQRQFEFDMLTRREEMEQLRREFELMHQTAKAPYDIDKLTLEAKLRKLNGSS
ncbi:hypothetical protein AC1031_019263 [Aphanomyces cochlioides]|nr:hypothetical protein AC1031_019263 [Aphanomyces cochlioides]